METQRMPRMPHWLIRLLPMWDYICPKCKHDVRQKSHRCEFCGEKYGMPMRVPPKMLKDHKLLAEYVHKHVMPKVSLEQRMWLTNYFTVFLTDGFEANNYNLWTGVDGTPSTQGVIKHTGNFASECDLSVAGTARTGCYLNLGAAQSVLYMRAYVYFTAYADRLAGSHYLELLRFSDSAVGSKGILEMGTDFASGDHEWALEYADAGGGHTAVSFDPTPLINTWFCVEVGFVKDAVNGAWYAYVNNAPVISVTGLDTSTITVDQVQAEGWYNDGTSAGILYHDDIQLGDQFNGMLEPMTMIITGTATLMQ